MNKTGKSILTPKRVDIGLLPIDAALSLRHLPGFLFFDSSKIYHQMRVPYQFWGFARLYNNWRHQ